MLSAEGFFNKFGFRLIWFRENPSHIDFSTLEQTFQLTSIVTFAALIVLLRNIDFKMIFRATVVFSGLAMLIGGSLFPNSLITYFLIAFFCPKALLLLGWAYINQMANKHEGIRYYFALNFMAGILVCFINIVSQILFVWLFNSGNATVLPSLPAWFGIICLVLVWIFDRIIHKRMNENEEAENTLTTQIKWLPVTCLGIIASGLSVVYKINQPEFTAQMKKLFATNHEYICSIPRYSVISGCAILCFSAFTMFIGPKIVEKKGWKYAVLIAPIAVFLAILLSSAKITTWTFPVGQLITQFSNKAWIILLVQIAFLSYAKKTRFYLQAWTFLVVAALIEFGFAFANLGHMAASIASCVILALMVASTYILSKPNNSMELPQ
jgi:hypothetical protein